MLHCQMHAHACTCILYITSSSVRTSQASTLHVRAHIQLLLWFPHARWTHKDLLSPEPRGRQQNQRLSYISCPNTTYNKPLTNRTASTSEFLIRVDNLEDFATMRCRVLSAACMPTNPQPHGNTINDDNRHSAAPSESPEPDK